MNTALKVLHNISPKKLYQALVHTKTEGHDEVKILTEEKLKKITKLKRKIWSVRWSKMDSYSATRNSHQETRYYGMEEKNRQLGSKNPENKNGD